MKIENYDRFCGLGKYIAKKHIPRGFRKQYVPGWNTKCNELYDNYLANDVHWNDVSPCNYHLCIDPTLKPEGFDLQRESWKRLNRIRTGHGCCNSCLFKWNLTNSPACDVH